MAEQVIEASQLGFGTVKYTGFLSDVSLLDMVGGTVNSDVSGFDIYVVSAGDQMYYENDGTEADADSMLLDTPGLVLRGRNQKSAFERFRFFCAGVVDIRVTLWG